LPGEAVLQLKNQGVTIQDGAELYEAITGKVPIDCVGSSGLLSCSGPRASLPWLIYQTIAPPVFSSICLVLSLPVMALIAVAIRLDSRGPAIFRQQRVGQHGKVFTLYKFRTMVDGADPVDRYRPAQITDPRCTRVGRLLRRSRLDELPQLFNICRGEMRFVGPRPFVPNQEQECLEGIRNYCQRWAVKPGATGWAQVNRGYCVSMRDNQEKLAYDLFYIKNASFGLDLLILLKTIKLLLLRRGGR
jgi:lipopolysaccharide/colanic/teichoic acid biosynthesis glycosyltransferase